MVSGRLDRHIDFDDFDSLAAATPPHVTIGAVDLNSGKFETFSDDAITPETVSRPPRIRCCTRPSR